VTAAQFLLSFQTALHLAAGAGEGVVKALLEGGAVLEVSDKAGAFPLHTGRPTARRDYRWLSTLLHAD